MEALVKVRIAAALFSAAALTICASTEPTRAQDWPQQPVRVVVSAAAGGPIDVFARIVADRLSKSLGQNVFIENVPGAGGSTGGQRVARAAPDGYTILLGTSATHTFSQVLYKKPLYDAEADFAPVALLAEIPLVLIVRKDLPVSNLKEFAAYAKANGAKMNYGSAGAGSSTHLGCALLMNAIGADVQHVPYRGTGPAMQDLQAGRLDLLCEIVVTAVPQVNAGTVKAIATMSQERSPVLPNTPTTVEAGFPSALAYSFTALLAPKGTSPSIIAKLNAAAQDAMEAPDVRQRLEKLGATIVRKERRSPEYLAKYIGAEIAKWRRIVATSGLPLQ